MDFPTEQINQITNALTAITDPTTRAQTTGAMLDAVPALQRALREIRQAAVIELRARGMSHADVAKVLGISRARAQQVAEGRTSGKRATAQPDE